MLEVLKEGEVEPNYLDFLDRIEEAAHIGDKEKTGISAGIIHRDFVTIENAWENYVHVNPQSMLSVLTKRNVMLQQRREAEAVNGEQDNGEGEDGREKEVKEELAEGKEGVTEGEVAEDLGILETPEEDATNDANSPALVTPRTCHTTQIVSANGFDPVSPTLRNPGVDNTTLDGDWLSTFSGSVIERTLEDVDPKENDYMNPLNHDRRPGMGASIEFHLL
ncbi:hypothetical protein ACHAQE_010436 [Botrytis cinerea]